MHVHACLQRAYRELLAGMSPKYAATVITPVIAAGLYSLILSFFKYLGESASGSHLSLGWLLLLWLMTALAGWW